MGQAGAAGGNASAEASSTTTARPLSSVVSPAFTAKLYGGLDSIIGGAWHAFARYLDKTFQQIEAQAHLAWTQAEILAGHVYDVTGLRQAVHSLTDTFRGIEHGIKDLRKLWHGIEARVKQLEHDLTKGIGHDLRIEVKDLERGLGRVEHKVIPALRGEVTAAENEVTELKNWLTKNVPLAGTATFAGIIAAALGTLGLGWLRCKSNPFNNNKNACGLLGDLSQLLGAIATVIAVEDFQALVKEMQEAEKVTAEGLHDLLNL